MSDRVEDVIMKEKDFVAHRDTLSPDAVFDERTTDASSVSIALMLSNTRQSNSKCVSLVLT